MYKFEVKQKDRSRILYVFHLSMALFLALDLWHVQDGGRRDWVFSAVYSISCLFMFVAVIFHKQILADLTRHLSLLLFESTLIFCGAIYFWSKGIPLVAFSHGVLAGVIILFWIYLKKRVNGEVIIVSEANISFPGLAGDRIIEWNELANVIKKYDLVSFDFKNNKLVQVEVTNSDNINENEFNQFCQQQLSKEAGDNR